MDKTTKTSYVLKRLLECRFRFIVILNDNEFYFSGIDTWSKKYIEFFKPTYDVKYKS